VRRELNHWDLYKSSWRVVEVRANRKHKHVSSAFLDNSLQCAKTDSIVLGPSVVHYVLQKTAIIRRHTTCCNWYSVGTRERINRWNRTRWKWNAGGRNVTRHVRLVRWGQGRALFTRATHSCAGFCRSILSLAATYTTARCSELALRKRQCTWHPRHRVYGHGLVGTVPRFLIHIPCGF
jgi:hypothetical protein